MKQVVWKFPIQMIKNQVISMPYGSKILCVQIQHEKPQLWALCNPDETPSDRWIDIIGTGTVVEDLLTRTYIGTFQHLEGDLIWHVFERHI